MVKLHPKHRLLVLLSRLHGKRQFLKAVEIDKEDDVQIFEVHDVESQEEIADIQKKLATMKQKIKDKQLTDLLP